MWWTIGRAAWACSVEPFSGTFPTGTIDPTDTDAPAAPIVEVAISRGEGDDGKSCEDIGSVAFRFDRAAGDPDPVTAIGYRFEVVDGRLPLDLPRELYAGPELSVAFGDGDGREPFSATVAVTAVDLAGNVSEPVTVEVSDPGREGCDAAGGVGLGWLGPLLAVTAVRRSRAAR